MGLALAQFGSRGWLQDSRSNLIFNTTNGTFNKWRSLTCHVTMLTTILLCASMTSLARMEG